MKKKIFSVTAMLMSALMLLSACGGGSAAPASSGGGDATTSAASGGDTAPAPASEASLVYYSMWTEAEPQALAIADACKAYTEKTGVNVEIKFQGRDTRKTLQPALEAGTVIDIFDEDVERVNGQWSDWLLDVEEMAGQVYDSTDGKPFTDVVRKDLIDLARSLGPDGKLSTIPYQPSTFIVMYNKAIFDEAGIAAPPKTWDEFLDACEKIKAIGKTAITVDDAYMAALVGYHMGRLVGRDATVAIADSDKWDNPAVKTLGEQWQVMAEKGYISKNAAGNIYPMGQQEIASGDVAMYLNGTWLPNEIKDSAPADFQWGSFGYPAVGPDGDGPEANQYGAQCFGINKNTKYPQEAFDLLVWLTTGEWDVKLAEQSLGVPMANDSAWPAQLAEAKAVLDSTTTRYPWAVGMENKPEVNAKIKKNFALLISGQLDAQGFYDAMQVAEPAPEG